MMYLLKFTPTNGTPYTYGKPYKTYEEASEAQAKEVQRYYQASAPALGTHEIAQQPSERWTE